MKIIEILEAAIVAIKQPKLWHLTEKANLSRIKRDGMMLPKSQMRGAQYRDNRLHFSTSITPAALEEIEGIVRFGGVDFDDDKKVLARQDVSLVLLELDMNELHNFDEQMEWVREWHRDEGITYDIGVWTSKPIPMDALSVIKTL